MKKVLLVYYSLGGNTKAAVEAIAEGIRKGGAEPIIKMSLNANAEDFLTCDGLVLGSPDYFSYMAGGLKDFFDRTYYQTKGKVDGKPYIVLITSDGAGVALKSVLQICRKFKLNNVAKPIIIHKKPDKKATDKLMELGRLFALLLESSKYEAYNSDIFDYKYVQYFFKIINRIRYRNYRKYRV